MTHFRRSLVGALLALCASAALASRSIAPPAVDDETTQTHQHDTHIAMAVWVPNEVFRDAAGADIDPKDLKALLAALKGYSIIGIVDVELTVPDGNVVSADRAKLRSSARLQLGSRPPRAIVPDSALPPTVAASAAVFKKLMGGMIGKFGDSIEFVVFRDADEHGESLADPRGSGPMTLTFDKETFTWNLPLVGTLPLRVDLATGDTFPGDFDFSPFTGHKLETVAK